MPTAIATRPTLERATHPGAHFAAVRVVRALRALDASGLELRPVVGAGARD